MFFAQYISHPGKTEDDTDTLLIGEDGRFDANSHLRTVADRMREASRGQTLADGTQADRVAEVVGLTHDFAKLTSWAQKHLRGQPFQQRDSYRYHAFPGALVTLYCLLECDDREVGGHAAEVATLVVAGHHNIRSPPEPTQMAEQYGRKGHTEKYKRVCEQFDDIGEHAAQQANRIIHEATGGTGSWEEFKQWHDNRTDPLGGNHDHLMYFARMGDRNTVDGYYADVVQLWTALKSADQTAASGIEDDDFRGVLPDYADLDRHVADLEEGTGVLAELNALRNQAKKEVEENIDALVESNDVGLITLPTGFGKTYAGLSAGLRAADINETRLVYVLPYTSILDQTASEIQSIFGVSPYSRAFSLHHHLSDTYTNLDHNYTDTDIGRQPGALHAESWRTGLTLTTTVQLFESLAAPTARQSTRVPSLNDAVVVVDEPQTIPEDWWQIVPKLVELLVDRYNATVILMTATQPGLVTYGSDKLDTRELTDETDQYTAFLAEHPRVSYRLHETVRRDLGDENATLGYQTAGRRVFEPTRDGSDVLSICNTRASARELYRCTLSAGENTGHPPVELGRLLHRQVSETGELPTAVQLRKRTLEATERRNSDTVYAFLSGDVRPDDRALLIDALYDDSETAEGIKPLLDSELSVALVSTSVVEAGVDISFDTVFRDYAPIPNIVQSGGRCNRSFDGNTGEVVIWRLAEPEDGWSVPSLGIHGASGGDDLPLLRATSRVLERHATEENRINESTMVSDTVSDFYELLFKRGLNPGDEQLAEAVDKAAMSELADEHMITAIEDYEDVVACLTARERDELLTAELDVADIGEHPGAQINTDPTTWGRKVAIGSSRYLILDATSSPYHPVFGVK